MIYIYTDGGVSPSESAVNNSISGQMFELDATIRRRAIFPYTFYFLFFCHFPPESGKKQDLASLYIQRNLFKILLLILNQAESVRLLFQINRKIVNTI